MQTIRSVPYAKQCAPCLAGVFYFFLLKTLIMQKFKLSWMALLRNERDSWGNWNKQGKWSKPGVQNEKGSDKYKESCGFFNSRTPTK